MGSNGGKGQRELQKKKVSGELASLGLPTPERFLFTQFAAMPIWVRVITYFVLLIVVVHGYLVPRAVSGTVETLSEQGATRTAYANSLVSVVGDRSTRYFANGRDDGTWSIPVPTQLPVGFELEFADKDNPQGREKLQVCATDVLLNHAIEVRYHPDGVGARFTRIDPHCQPGKPSGGADGGAAGSTSISFITRAFAQAVPVKVTSPKDVSRAISGAVQESGANPAPDAPTDSRSALRAASTLNIQLSTSEAAGVRSKEQLSQLLQQKYYGKEIGDAGAVYLYAGEINDNGNWDTPPNLKLDANDNQPRPFRPGDVVTAQTHVNKRSDYIRFTILGWRNADSVGVTEPGDHFVVQETKLIGNNLWVKAVPVKIDK